MSDDEARVRLDDEQLLCLMTAIIVGGRVFGDLNTRTVWRSIEAANEIFDRIIRHQEYTECEGLETPEPEANST